MTFFPLLPRTCSWCVRLEACERQNKAALDPKWLMIFASLAELGPAENEASYCAQSV